MARPTIYFVRSSIFCNNDDGYIFTIKNIVTSKRFPINIVYQRFQLNSEHFFLSLTSMYIIHSCYDCIQCYICQISSINKLISDNYGCLFVFM